jgi:hypothetical protein
MPKYTKFQEALGLIASLAGRLDPVTESDYEELKAAEKFLSKHDPTMNIDKAVRLLDKARNDQDSTFFLRITIVDHVGTWAAGQKSSPQISKLLSDCHHLHQRFSSLPEKIHFVVDKQ